jgi:predicted RNA binding protein YcfA (HicA-like mRNA interferase family)
MQRAGWVHVSTSGDHAKLRKGSERAIVPLHKELKGGTLASWAAVGKLVLSRTVTSGTRRS